MAPYLTEDQQKFLIKQDWNAYTKAEHAMWRRLCKRQTEVLQDRAFPFFLESMKALNADDQHLPNFTHVNGILKNCSGWEIVPVNGLIPELDFFQFLASKKFPTTTFIRKPEEIDYLEAPDIFHDLYGHVPMLMQPVFANYMELFGKKGIEALKHGFTTQIARLYWFTVEFGLIRTPKGLRIYGAGIVSSKNESIYCLESDVPHRLEVNLERIMRTDFYYHDLQKMYFVIDHIDQLYRLINTNLMPYYEAAAKKGDILDYALIEGDCLIKKSARLESHADD